MYILEFAFHKLNHSKTPYTVLLSAGDINFSENFLVMLVYALLANMANNHDTKSGVILGLLL